MATIRPSRCTSLSAQCDPRKATACPRCSHAEYDGSATIDGRTYRWAFNPILGPQFWGSRGRELTAPRAALWRAFKAWLQEHFGKDV